MPRGKPYRMRQMTNAKRRTEKLLRRWGMLDDVTAEEKASIIGHFATTRRRCSCFMCSRERWSQSRAAKRAAADEADGMKEINSKEEPYGN